MHVPRAELGFATFSAASLDGGMYLEWTNCAAAMKLQANTPCTSATPERKMATRSRVAESITVLEIQPAEMVWFVFGGAHRRPRSPNQPWPSIL